MLSNAAGEIEQTIKKINVNIIINLNRVLSTYKAS